MNPFIGAGLVTMFAVMVATVIICWWHPDEKREKIEFTAPFFVVGFVVLIIGLVLGNRL